MSELGRKLLVLLLLVLLLLLLLLVLMNLTSSMVNIIVRVLLAVLLAVLLLLLLSVRLSSSMRENNSTAVGSQHSSVPGRNINLKDERDVVRRVLRIWESNAVFFFVILISIVDGKRGGTVAVRRTLPPRVILRTRRRRTLSCR